MERQRFADALEELDRARSGDGALYGPFVDYFPVDGAAISTLGALLGTETVAASDARAARVDELQFDLGEGPCWAAMTTARPVAEPDLRRAPSNRWPAFEDAISREDIGAVYALPMVIGSLRIGAIDLYSREACELDDQELQRGETMAKVVARHLFSRRLDQVGRAYRDESPHPHSRRVIHQATGMVLAQLDLSAADARLVIEGHAFATGATVMDVAQRIVDRDLVLDELEGDDG